ncbi:MAG TPA: HD domain-containing phosphohydrolase [Vicinamibacterales bacterium]|nr:HD domain-containing phosphohydrolase [Vicinamibacterales bacterium]
MTDRTTVATADPDRILKAFSALVTLTGMYPSGHPLVAEKLREVHDGLQQHLKDHASVQLDVIRGVLHLNGVASGTRTDGYGAGIDSLHVDAGLRIEELAAVAEFLSHSKIDPGGEPVRALLMRRGVEHVSLGRIVPLDTRWRSRQWPDRPQHALDPDYEESLALAEHAFEQLAAERVLDVRAVGDLVRLLMFRVVASHAALAQILTVKQYENLTYIHSVNVAVLSLLIGRQIGLDDQTLPALVEAAVLHDVGKTRIPLELVKKPGALDKRERKMMEAHPVLGAEILMQVDGLRPATPLVALEHHRTVVGGGYPDIGDGVVPHVLSQIVSVADIYEAVTGARSYQVPTPPERACLLLARLAGTKLNAAIVKAFVNAISFFPIGSLVRTSRDELAIVIRTNPNDPLHPILQLVDEAVRSALGEVDTARRDADGAYERHIVETVVPAGGAPDVRPFVTAA